MTSHDIHDGQDEFIVLTLSRHQIGMKEYLYIYIYMMCTIDDGIIIVYT